MPSEPSSDERADASRERRPRLTPPIANVRRAVRAMLPDAEGALVLVALSGGADSLALAAATAFEAPRAGARAGAVIVDHGLQDASHEVAARAAAQAHELGLEPVLVRRVEVAGEGGPEGAARTARYTALDAAAAETGAALVLLGHTLDDQAETVLLGLARGSGGASLAGMAPRAGRYARPLLGIRRAETRQACADAGLTFWDDPHNTDASYARVRVRERVLPVLEAELGPGIAEALARTAEQLREDEIAFDAQIEEFIEEICEPAEAGIAVSVGVLEANPAALRQRIIRHVVASEFGVSLSRTQTLEVARLATEWHGQGPIDLPGGAKATRVARHVVFSATGATEILPHDH
ncbi:tRNA lysidine(34) synthetase TilS [Agromyces aerolatus]|uniref:tRNA lysidine(34) synthetase TilS n=1 Tax=Agromyces sp. LY-1074 TaxID=3074080 RepID=UPI002861268F|nr:MULTISPECIES: tRNA lysidine(34) synthetase TilS [unclassified Agromyces]MDR5698491.1 tRNA lysidine(34) synthetase TilS [Agromyces sp. LY-1074]MDR5704785.1 tRNA lysidine(34) synthetase TilS [Agromyces sp. LY-1358]